MAIQKKLQKLPAKAVQELALSRQDKKAFKANIKALIQEGWTAQAIANVTGFSAERLRQMAREDGNGSPTMDIPEPPQVNIDRGPNRSKIKPDPEVLERLLELKPMAQSVRFKHTKGRLETEEYTRLIAQEIERGVYMSRMARALGVTPQGLKLRLIRYGYADPTEKLARNNPALIQPVKYRAKF